ncbi:uncharacterized protein LOC117177548 isoform X2 [Belonocnema kinseyi]|uniref:uncharacterized protein LOC117177548 isoform X2 n=1 Tax=Belonocnema kinseyi TaxID=2817044 RepID=UPI00143D6F31|nr:uncharacterized protein LOC117177548 isoform X2 [Belonocnema kinseyi]XP_033224238.1 uncharacterized protein LOC117177548 isoform X2 [Belonocnema kinseyi]XP_033224239.1 uncharacterized protein LOC117177548 isoform X2 [Belonocnema kinseyi]XP_033224240.1 uncharacterized protein LOC117177548 isoform X2 [Belonocnema kinseyi]
MQNSRETCEGKPSNHKNKDSSESQISSASESLNANTCSNKRRKGGMKSKSYNGLKRSRLNYENNVIPNTKDPDLLNLRIIKCMHVVHLDQLETQRQLKDIDAKLAASIKNDDLPQNFAEKYNLTLPIASIEDFLSMEAALQSYNSFKAGFKNSSILMDRDNLLTRTFTNILK